MTLETTLLSTLAAPEGSQASELLSTLNDRLVAYAPTFLLFAGVLFAGLLVSAVLRRVTVWMVEKSGLDALAEKLGTAKLLYAIGVKRSAAHALGAVVWVASLLVTVAASTEVLGLSAVSSVFDSAVRFLPRLVGAAIVVLAGATLASLLRRIVRSMSKESGEIDSPGALGSVVYYVVLTVSILVAADQAGINTALIDSLVTISVAVGLAGVALAFALGAKDAFRNLVAGHYLQRLIRRGDEVVIAGVRGVVVRFSPVAVVLQTQDGQKIVPTRSLLDETIDVHAVPDVPRVETQDSDPSG